MEISRNSRIRRQLGFFLLLLAVKVGSVDVKGNKSSSSSSFPLFYNGKYVSACSRSSPEQFYWQVAQPSLTELNEKIHGFFGLLMDKLEDSMKLESSPPPNQDKDEEDEVSLENEEEEEDRMEKQWLYIMETIQLSLDTSVDRIKRGWALFVQISHLQPLPWEKRVKVQALSEVVYDLEYNYVMLASVVKAGVKEVVGTLQKRVVQVIQELEKHVRDLTPADEDVQEEKLLAKMEQSFQKIKADFISKLLRRIVRNAINRISISKSKQSDSLDLKLFFSKEMEQVALVFQAYRHKVSQFPNFWPEITEIMASPKDEHESSLPNFLQRMSGDTELFVETVFAVLVSNIPSPRV